MPEYIEREALIENLNRFAPEHYSALINMLITKQPTADVAEVKHGEWVRCDGKSNLWYCSECGDKILYNPTRRTYNIRKRPVNEVNKYCRCCGAKMDKKENGNA